MGIFSELRNLLALKRELRPKPEPRIYRPTKKELEWIRRKQRDFEKTKQATHTLGDLKIEIPTAVLIVIVIAVAVSVLLVIAVTVLRH